MYIRHLKNWRRSLIFLPAPSAMCAKRSPQCGRPRTIWTCNLSNYTIWACSCYTNNAGPTILFAVQHCYVHDKEPCVTQTDLQPLEILSELGIRGTPTVTSLQGGFDTAMWKVECEGQSYA